MFGRKKNETPDPTGFEGRLVVWRRHIHAHPELSYEERETTEYIEGELRSMGLKPERFEVGTGLWCDVAAADSFTVTSTDTVDPAAAAICAWVSVQDRSCPFTVAAAPASPESD